jgi:RNA polymerase sigma-70 factor (ECF subfamily)
MQDLDPRYVALIVGGDQSAFGSWMAACERPVRESLRSFAASVDTESVVQETFLRVWQVAPRFAPDGAPNGLFRLALRIARNLAVSETRRIRAQPLASEDLDALPSDAIPSSAVDPLLRKTLDGCREQLPPQPARAIAERIQSAGADDDRVLAMRVGMQLNTFLQNVTRARKLLLECLEQRGFDPSVEWS